MIAPVDFNTARVRHVERGEAMHRMANHLSLIVGAINLRAQSIRGGARLDPARRCPFHAAGDHRTAH